MTPKDAYKIGFLTKMAALGFTPKEALGMMEKKALVGDEIAKVYDTIKDMGISGLGIGLAGSAALGMGTGWLHSQLYDVTPDDIELSKLNDYSGTYRSEAARIRREAARRKWRDGKTDATGGANDSRQSTY
jgi:hypothetical protein